MERWRTLVPTLSCLAVSAMLGRVYLPGSVLLLLAGALLFCRGLVLAGKAVQGATCSACLCIFGLWLLPLSSGVLLFGHLALCFLLFALLLRGLLQLSERDREKVVVGGYRVVTVAIAVLATLAVAEAALRIVDKCVPADSGGLFSRLRAIPSAWAWRRAHVEGAELAFYWHGILHVNDINGMRRTAPFQRKRPGVFRIVVVGDSFTYGEGVDAEKAYPAVLEQLLGATCKVEVLNLGVRGLSLPQIRKLLRNYLDLLDPDLVAYGICLNDFSVETARDEELVQVRPLSGITDFFGTQTVVYPFLLKKLENAELRLHLQKDFYQDALASFDAGKPSYAQEAALLNAMVLERGLPPVVAMVLEQRPKCHGAGSDLALAVEDLMVAAGITVVPCRAYFSRCDGQEMVVSEWEQHPNAQAHRVFAEEFAGAIRGMRQLEPFRLSPPQPL
ncbi:MAG: hypothetical protein A3K19_32165 [Lentisphaerae bacterium RIFOXYB12_FULL_65_16]|nr:MAG: hypothetical protein A3K18_10945 [Lentisphaerae bacterium RIFOXYA12_64_32]OGV88757.1 MAG: hypothetical protein A3K19_32165 [Lentisphaerae bacterium RIFOXYB12_FULL_65_16]